MRRYVILFRRGKGNWGRLEPGTHRTLYDRPEIHAAIQFMRDNPTTEGMSIRLGDEQFNVVAVLDEAANSFTFEEGTC